MALRFGYTPCIMAPRLFFRTPLAQALLAGPLVGLLLTAGTSDPAASTESAAAEFRLLAGGGTLFFWDGASTELSPAPPGIASASQGFRSVLPLGDGRVLLVEPAAPSSGKEKEKNLREGEAVILGLRGTATERGPVVGFEGAPQAAAVSPDGRRAFVLSWRGSPGIQGSRGWLHAIDLERAAVLDSSLLSSVASGIATDASGRRLYVALKDRIQTYGAEPMRVSWQYRSPGANGSIAVAPRRDLLAVARGRQVALFDAETLAARTAEERRSRTDDATTVATLPFNVTRLAWAQDGSLLAAISEQGLVFLDPGNGALLWPATPTIDFSGSTDAQVLEFPGPDHDVVVALTPGGTVSALRAPVPSMPPPAAEPPAVAPPPAEPAVAAAPEVVPAPAIPAPIVPAPIVAAPVVPVREIVPEPVAGSISHDPKPTASHDPAPPAAATHESPGGGTASQDAATPAPGGSPPVEKPDEGPPLLRGRVTGKIEGARTIVLYGPDNILKEATRVAVQPDGTWSLPLPAPGHYRIVAIGDGSTPIPVVPSFRTVNVRAGIAESGIDFEVRPAP
ncbi:MAG TPA: hypothetical protein VFQ07_03665 [Candidatus Polarisedimenticolia bacterium]|nr:hypothetical protein [Candidatus Polarisedimenticolia bacterium]